MARVSGRLNLNATLRQIYLDLSRFIHLKRKQTHYRIPLWLSARPPTMQQTSRLFMMNVLVEPQRARDTPARSRPPRKGGPDA
jgi:hypothetical protein